MSGRGRSRGGRDKFQVKTTYMGEPKKEYKETKKSINNWNYYLWSKRQALEYEVMTEFIINYIKQNFEFGNDIAIAIIHQDPIATKIWKPTMLFSRYIDPELKEMKNKQFKIEFKANYNLYHSRQQIHNNYVTKAYTLFWDRCAKGMKNKITSRTDFKTKIKNNPIELLQAMKEHFLNYQEKKYNMSIILDSMKTLLTTRQKEGESLQDYTKRFGVTQEVFKSLLGGPIILTKILSTISGYNKKTSNELQIQKNAA
jgi:hypothetical protein